MKDFDMYLVTIADVFRQEVFDLKQTLCRSESEVHDVLNAYRAVKWPKDEYVPITWELLCAIDKTHPNAEVWFRTTDGTIMNDKRVIVCGVAFGVTFDSLSSA